MSGEARSRALAEEMRSCVCTALRRASREVTRFYDAALKAHRLQVTQLPILVAAGTAGPRQAVPMPRVAAALGMDRTTLLRNVRPLVRRKLVEVMTPAGSRHSVIRATAAGRALLVRLYPEWKRAQDQMLRRVAGQEWARTLDSLAAAAARGASP